MPVTQYGKTVKWNNVELAGVIVQSCDATKTWEVKTFKEMEGDEVAGVQYNARADFNASIIFLNDTTPEQIQTAFSTWAQAQTVTLLDLPAGGTFIINSFKVSLAQEDAQKADISGTYYPAMTRTA